MPRTPRPWYWEQRDIWCVEIGRKRHTLARGKHSKAEAHEEFHRLMVSLGRGEKQHRLTAADLFDMFLEDVCRAVERGDRVDSTYQNYVRFLSSAADRFGQVRATDLNSHQVHAWVEARDLKWNPTTRANGITAVKAAFRWARRRGLLREDPIRDMEKPTRKRREAVLTDEQVRTVLDATAGTPFADLVAALWESGCRPSEVTTLTVDRVDLAAGVWMVRNKTRRKTGQEFRPVYLTPALVEISRRLVGDRAEGLVFRNARAGEWTRNAQACAWRRVREKLGLGGEATSYAIRHRYAMEGLRRGLDASEVAALMGHTDVSMVNKVYGHWEQQGERLREAARKVRPAAASGDAGAAEGTQVPEPSPA